MGPDFVVITPSEHCRAGFKPNSKVFTALTPETHTGVPASTMGGLNFGGGPGGWAEQLPAVLAQWERQRKVRRAHCF